MHRVFHASFSSPILDIYFIVYKTGQKNNCVSLMVKNINDIPVFILSIPDCDKNQTKNFFLSFCFCFLVVNIFQKYLYMPNSKYSIDT